MYILISIPTYESTSYLIAREILKNSGDKNNGLPISPQIKLLPY